MHKVSVIIPVYNGERYLRECLDSVCGQTLRDIEIICVDDESNDSSCEIIREYMAKDNRVSLYQQKNQYCGIARNTGFDHADGEYVAFWDCDDIFEPDALESMYNRSKEVDADLCLCRVNAFDDARGIKAARRSDINLKRIPAGDWFNRESNENYILNCTPSNVWNKLYRKAFLDEIGLRFPPHRNAEDIYFTSIVLCTARRITWVDKALVNYRVRSETSQSNQPDKKDSTLLMQILCLTAEYLKEHDIFPERSFVNAALTHLRRGLRKFNTIPKQLEAIEYLQKNCLDTLCIRQREPGFYHDEENERMADALLTCSPEAVLGYLNRETAISLSVKTMRLNAANEEIRKLREQMNQLNRELKQQKKKLNAIKRSRAYRLAKKLSSILHKIRHLFHR